MADANRAPDEGWLVLIYRVPSEPSRLRSAVWRRLKSLGAIYLQNSAAALPASVGNERALRKLRSQILDMEGTAALLACRVLAGEQEVRATFQAARNDEYEEIVNRCEDFLGQVKKEYVATTSPTPSLRRTRSIWSSCGPGSPGSARGTRSARPAAPKRRRPSRPASSRWTTTRRGSTRRKKTATDRPRRYLLATVHLLTRSIPAGAMHPQTFLHTRRPVPAPTLSLTFVRT